MNMARMPKFAIFVFTLIIQAAYAQTPSNSSRIAGTVVSAATGTPLAGARVFINEVKNQKNQASMLTDSDGHFFFANVPPGKYSLLAAQRGYVTGAYDQHEEFATAIVTGTGLDTEHLTLRLQPSAVISGKILDEAEEPVREANVTLFHQDHRSGEPDSTPRR